MIYFLFKYDHNPLLNKNSKLRSSISVNAMPKSNQTLWVYQCFGKIEGICFLWLDTTNLKMEKKHRMGTLVAPVVGVTLQTQPILLWIMDSLKGINLLAREK